MPTKVGLILPPLLLSDVPSDIILYPSLRMFLLAFKSLSNKEKFIQVINRYAKNKASELDLNISNPT